MMPTTFIHVIFILHFVLNEQNMLMAAHIVSFDYLILSCSCDGQICRLLHDIIKQLAIIECNEMSNDADDKTCREQIHVEN